MSDDMPSPAVLADDLRALAEMVPFERLTLLVLEQAADTLDAMPGVAPQPLHEDIADAIQNVLDSGLYEVTITQDGRPAELWQLARALDKAGLIDWAGVTP